MQAGKKPRQFLSEPTCKCLRCNLEKNRSLEAGPLPLSSAELTDAADKKGREPKVGRTSLARKNNFKVCCFPPPAKQKFPVTPASSLFSPIPFHCLFFCCGTVWRIFRVVGQVCTAVQTPREDKRNERIKAGCRIVSSFFPPDGESTQRGTDRSVQRLPFERCEIRLTFYLAKKREIETKGKSRSIVSFPLFGVRLLFTRRRRPLRRLLPQTVPIRSLAA